MIKSCVKRAGVFLIIAVLLEIVMFNGRHLLSLNASEQYPEYYAVGDTYFAEGMSGEPGYLYLGLECLTETGGTVPVTLTISVQDEGNAEFYELFETTVYPSVEKSKYLKICSYGAVKALSVKMQPTVTEAEVSLSELIYDARVPWFFSVPRVLLLFGVFCLLWVLRPSSSFYVYEWKKWQRRLAVAVLISLNAALFLLLVRSNPAFLNPVWPYHQQYYELAQSLSRGSVSIDVGSDEMLDALAAMENPYDNSARMQSVPGADSVWDTCYYKGKFYVYFGVVPVLLFYLPWYLLFHSAFPTWLGVFLAGTGAVGGMYYLLGQIRRRWFQELPYGLYLVLAAISANSLNLFCAMLHADFYYLPILLALCFSLWGLGLAVSAVDRWRQGQTRVGVRLAGGALCLALTAGCRPQFLAGSFLLLPLLLPTFMENRKVRRAWQYLAAAALPYLLVAAGLMYYNFIRFGSVFDFGAAYNLTTNDMTQRGFHLERLPDGFFMYLFQPPSLRLEFPFVEVTSFYSTYPGTTIMDWTFGGAFWTRCILLGVLGIVNVRRELREKKLYGFAVLSFLMALVVVAADTELSGILNRYFMDFLWLLVIPAVVILMQLSEKYRNADCRRWILWFIILAGAAGILCELGMAFRGSGLMNDNAHRYYIIKSLFQ